MHDSFDTLFGIFNNLVCLQNKAVIVQQIATGGAQTLYLFYTAQGVILILGNFATGEQRDHTQIYRFQPENEKVK